MDKLILELIAKLVMTLNSKQDWADRIPRHLPVKTRHGKEFIWIDSNGCSIYKLISVAEYESEVNNG